MVDGTRTQLHDRHRAELLSIYRFSPAAFLYGASPGGPHNFIVQEAERGESGATPELFRNCMGSPAAAILSQRDGRAMNRARVPLAFFIVCHLRDTR